MKTLQKIITAGLAGAVILATAGCDSSNTNKPGTQSSETPASSETSASETISETTVPETTAEPTEESSAVETIVYEKGDSLTRHNVFLSNFAEQGIALLDTETCTLKEVVEFAEQWSYYNKQSNLSSNGTYRWISVDKVQEVAGTYLNYIVNEDEISSFKPLPEGDGNIYDPIIDSYHPDWENEPFYKDGNFYFYEGAGERFTMLAIIDYADDLGDGTYNLHFTVYELSIDKVNEFDGPNPDGWNTYYAMTSEEASKDPDLTARYSGVAHIGEGQIRPYLIRYEVNR